MNKRKILIGEISSYKAIVIAEYLNTYYVDLEVVGFDYKKLVKKIHTKHCRHVHIVESPFKNKLLHIESIAQLITTNGIDYFIPVNSNTIGDYILARNKFGHALEYIGDISIYEQLHDKSKLAIVASEIGIKIPKTYTSFEKALIPFVAKPTDLSASKGIKYVRSEKARKQIFLTNNHKYIFQEYIQGVGCGYSVFSSEGKIIIGHGHLRHAEYPISGGSSVYRTSYYNNAMKDIVEKLLHQTKWSGFAMFEFKLSPSNELILIEVNPRIWGSINQGLQNGTNYFEHLIGQSNFIKKSMVNTYLSPLVYQALLNYILKLRFKPLILFLKNVRINRADISMVTDFKGFLSTILRKIL